MPSNPHQPLRDDVRLLGDLLGRTLRDQDGQELFERVERVRALSKGARGGRDGDFETLARELSAMPVEAALPVARAFAHFLTLANVAEQHHRIRRRRAYQQDPAAPPQRGSCAEVFARLVAGGMAPERLFDAVTSLRVELVLTAHPTEVARRTLVQKHNRIARALDRRDRVELTIPEQEEATATLLREITAAWGTPEVRAQRPSPLDEVRGGLTLFQESLWDAMPQYLRAVDRALRAATGQRLPTGVVPVRFGSWIGGDRDGNPHVTADVTRRASLLARWVAADLYVDDLQALGDELSVTRATADLREAVEGAAEPYRALMRRFRERMATTKSWIEECLRGDADAPPPPDVVIDETELAAALRLAEVSLRRCGFGVLAEGRLTDTRRRVAAFGLTLAPLDIRQDAARHEDAVAALARVQGLGDYIGLDEPGRIRFLIDQLQGARAADAGHHAALPPDVREVLDTCALIARLPAGALGAYIITMASRASDVLAVEWLQRSVGAARPLRAVPLFETGRDLERAGAILGELLAIPWYRARIAGRQEVMVGYSDSAKDIGRLAAGWTLYQAQEQIVRVCRDADVHVTLFHGRGGTVGRGGGPTYLALQSQPPGSVDGSIRVTEQGEMLQTLFGLPEIAGRTMEVYTTGVLESWLAPAAPAQPEWRACMDRLAADARIAYRRIVHEDPSFVEYFRAATPVREIGWMNIGSRPARRAGGSGGVESLRAIPWQFAWTQTRLILGAWLGVDTALEQADRRGEGDLLRRMYAEWPFFRSSIDLIEMVLAKTDARIAAEYDRRLVPPALQPLGTGLRGRLDRAMDGVRQVTGHRTLLESNAVLRRSIDVRNPYVDPINLVQIELLHRLRQADDEELRRALVITINGIAAGMRNTG